MVRFKLEFAVFLNCLEFYNTFLLGKGRIGQIYKMSKKADLGCPNFIDFLLSHTAEINLSTIVI